MPKVDITHTISPKNRPHPDARLIRDLDTGEANWVVDETVPEGYFDGPPNPPLGDKVDLIAAHAADVNAALDVDEKRLFKEALELDQPVSQPAAKPRHKKLHHG